MESRNVYADGKKPNLMEEIGPEKKEEEKKRKIIIRYRECMKNHAASIGGNARDGCGEFMASSGEDTLKCSACKCHRNFHRKQFESEDSDHDTPSSSPPYHYFHHHLPSKMVLSNYNIDVTSGDHHNHVMKPLLTHDLCLTSYNNNKSGGPNGSSDDHYECDDEKKVKMMKRFRTKFSEEQKEKMVRFAEKVGWRMQKVDQSMVQQFCEEAGINRRVLKVWMHNNKNSFAKRNHLISTS